MYINHVIQKHGLIAQVSGDTFTSAYFQDVCREQVQHAGAPHLSKCAPLSQLTLLSYFAFRKRAHDKISK